MLCEGPLCCVGDYSFVRGVNLMCERGHCCMCVGGGAV